MTTIGLFLTALALQAAIWTTLRVGFRRSVFKFRTLDDNSFNESTRKTTVVVAVKNEEENVHDLLQCLIDQNNNDLEIIIVDDHSSDQTIDRIRSFGYPNRIRLIVNGGSPGKKSALSLGIEASTSDILVFTDADCRPGPEWSSILAAALTQHEQSVVIGYSPFSKCNAKPKAGRYSFLNGVARYETFVTGFLTAAATGLGRSYMAVGRSIGYTRKAFESVGGFERIMHSLSGDDDLLIQLFQKEKIPIVHVFGQSSFVETAAPKTWLEWARQKTRHTSASRYYPYGVSLWLVLFQISGLILYLAPIFLGYVGLGILLAGMLIQWLALRSPSQELDERDLWLRQPYLHLAYSLYNLTIAPLGVFRRPKRW